MTQEEKELLFKDLSARLPYGVIGEYSWKGKKPYNRELTGNLYDELNSSWNSTEDSKFIPYLRPLSSMTEEEYDDMFSQIYSAQEEFFRNCSNVDTIGKIIANDSVRYDYLNKKMFDYRGLIPKGLAIEASEGMYGLPLTFK